MWIESLLHDVRYALRQLARTPGFTITAVLTLALGIGANTAIFTLVNAVLLKNLPVADPKTLVRVGDKDQCCARSTASIDGDYSIFSTYMYGELKKFPEFENLAAMQAGFQYRQIIARREGSENLARSVTGEFVSGNYFSTFGLEPAVGRLIVDSDDIAGASDTAVMSYETWKNDYNSDPAIVGSMFWVNSQNSYGGWRCAEKLLWRPAGRATPPELLLSHPRNGGDVGRQLRELIRTRPGFIWLRG